MKDRHQRLNRLPKQLLFLSATHSSVLMLGPDDMSVSFEKYYAGSSVLDLVGIRRFAILQDPTHCHPDTALDEYEVELMGQDCEQA